MKKEKKKETGFTTVLLIVIGLIGLSLVLYPSVSNYWNSTRQGKAIYSYVEQVDKISDVEALKNHEYWDTIRTATCNGSPGSCFM